jgi:hypothetical protein
MADSIDDLSNEEPFVSYRWIELWKSMLDFGDDALRFLNAQRSAQRWAAWTTGCPNR